MPGIVGGEERERLKEGPGVLPQDVLDKARKRLEERKEEEREKERRKKVDMKSKPKTCPPGFVGPRWSITEGQWVCCSRAEPHQWQIWDKDLNEWSEVKDYEAR
jgi:hypothetical protein